MAKTVDIYPSVAYWYPKVDKDWAIARDAKSSEAVFQQPQSQIGIRFDGENFTFFRTYLSFDLSDVPGGSTIDSIILSLQRVDEIKNSYTPNIAYAGNAFLIGDINEYQLYLDNTARGRDLAIIDIIDSTGYYQSDPFDIVSYPVSPGDILTVGIVDNYDFINDIGRTSDDIYLIDTDSLSNQPYLTVEYTSGGGGGYTKTVMGVPGANISTVSGVPSANIANIMGV
jgi:hypothetical protein